MTERGIPEDWSAGRAAKAERANRLSRSQQIGDIPPVPSNPADGGGKKRRRKPTNLAALPPQQLKQEVGLERVDSPDIPPKTRIQLPRWMKTWVFWAVLAALSSGSVGFMAMAMLFKLPAAPNCPAIFWPLASATVRLHCAQLAASKNRVDDLLQAIALVKSLPQDHPLRSQVDTYIEEWSEDILKLADESFQAGKLQEAINIAKKIPQEVSAYKLVEERIQEWESVWRRAEEIYREAEDELRQQRWHSAFMAAARLLQIGNNHWSTVKYDELTQKIQTARDDGNKLARAKDLAKTGRVKDLLAAIKIVESIQTVSYIYQEAQKTLPDLGRKLLEIAQNQLDRRDADEAIDIARQIPNSTKIQWEVQDFINLAEAQRSAWMGTVSALQDAILQAQKIGANRPLYDKSQQLVVRWQLEIEDVGRLEKARDLAQQGTVGDLTAAIAQAQMIPGSNPRASEARKEMANWQKQIETIEDRPYIDRADQLAASGDMAALPAAIAEASQVRSGRALYPEARRRVREWTGSIERAQDQPVLDQARAIASTGDLNSAIATLQPIASGRALSGEASAAINDWQGQLNARENWSRARQVAVNGSPDALAEAIRLANRVPSASPLRNDVNPMIEQWAEQMLNMALSRAEYDIPGAIEIARQIPRGNNAYTTARQQIRDWRRLLQPAPEPESTSAVDSTGESSTSTSESN